MFAYPEDRTAAPAAAETALTVFLAAITTRDFSTAQAMLCTPLRAEFPEAGALEERLLDELQILFTDFELLASRSASGNVRYALSRPNWGQGPLEVRMVQEEGAWRACGAGLEGSRLGFLVSGATGY